MGSGVFLFSGKRRALKSTDRGGKKLGTPSGKHFKILSYQQGEEVSFLWAIL